MSNYGDVGSPRSSNRPMLGLVPHTWATGLEPPRRDGRWILETEQEWLLDGPAATLDAVSQAFAEVCKKRITPTLLLLGFGRSVGRYTLPGVGEVELVSAKLREKDCDAMLRDLTEEAAALPFSRQFGSGLPYERVLLQEERVPYHAFIYL